MASIIPASNVTITMDGNTTALPLIEGSVVITSDRTSGPVTSTSVRPSRSLAPPTIYVCRIGDAHITVESAETGDPDLTASVLAPDDAMILIYGQRPKALSVSVTLDKSLTTPPETTYPGYLLKPSSRLTGGAVIFDSATGEFTVLVAEGERWNGVVPGKDETDAAKRDIDIAKIAMDITPVALEEIDDAVGIFRVSPEVRALAIAALIETGVAESWSESVRLTDEWFGTESAKTTLAAKCLDALGMSTPATPATCGPVGMAYDAREYASGGFIPYTLEPGEKILPLHREEDAIGPRFHGGYTTMSADEWLREKARRMREDEHLVIDEAKAHEFKWTKDDADRR